MVRREVVRAAPERLRAPRAGRPRRATPVAAACVAFAGAIAACKGDPPKREPPPPAASARPASACAAKPSLTDATAAPLFPGTASTFCLDPNGGDKAFGEGAPLPLDGICDLFDGECEIYKRYGVRRVVEARYIDGGGSTATLEVHLSKFATPEGAYGMFTQRVVGDSDPAGEDAPTPTPGGSAAALGIGIAYLYRGAYLAELTYSDANASEATTREKGGKVLPMLASAMGEKLPGELGLPTAASRLPKENLVPLGVRYETNDVLGVEGGGAGAVGYYRDGEKRYRVAVIVRPDVDQAKDVLATFGAIPAASKEKHVADGAWRITRKASDGGLPMEWVVARSGKTIVAVGDEERALRAGMSADEVAKKSLTLAEKIDRVKKIAAEK